jgi:hypothetical protein
MTTSADEQDASNEALDLTADAAPATMAFDQPPPAIPYDPRRQRESIRGVVAALLLGLLCFIVIASFLSYWLDVVEQDALEGLLTIIFAPVIGLVGAATGFYFGGSSDRAN